MASLEFSVRMRGILKRFPKEEQFDLIRQMKRASDSIGANLAEGSGRSFNMDQAHFTNMAYGSGMEMLHHLNLAYRLEYVTEEEYAELRLDLNKIVNQMNSLYKYQVNSKQSLKSKLRKD